jgi:hypothetical protein
MWAATPLRFQLQTLDEVELAETPLKAAPLEVGPKEGQEGAEMLAK